MDIERRVLLKNFFSNMQVNLTAAAHTHCWADWKDTDYIPEYNKFYYICDGEGWLKIGDQEYYPQKGQMFLMPAGIRQSYSTISENTFTKYWCHFTSAIGEINFFDIVRVPLYIHVINEEAAGKIFESLILNFNKNDLTSYLKSKSLLLELISFYLDNIPEKNISLLNSPVIEKLDTVIKYIRKNISRNITVEELAAIVHFHPNYFIRFFKNHMGLSPLQYINKSRLEKARLLLSAENMAIKEIAEVTGFCDVYHFSRVFKNATGFPPAHYRNSIRS